MEIRELRISDLASLLELYVLLSDVNKNYSYEKSLDVWKSEIEVRAFLQINLTQKKIQCVNMAYTVKIFVRSFVHCNQHTGI